MRPKSGWLTPNAVPTEMVGRCFYIPADYEYIVPAVMGALYPLTLADNWQKHGAVDPEVIASAMQLMYFGWDYGVTAMARLVGEVVAFAGATAPAGWLKCDGAQYQQSVYIDLANLLGDKYGAADNGYFRVPDMRGRVPAGAGTPSSGGVINWHAGNVIGEQKHTLSLLEMPSHSHVVYPSAAGSGAAYVGNGTNQVLNGNDTPYTLVQTFPVGGSVAHNNIQPTAVLDMFIIYTGVL